MVQFLQHKIACKNAIYHNILYFLCSLKRIPYIWYLSVIASLRYHGNKSELRWKHANINQNDKPSNTELHEFNPKAH